MLKFHNYDIVFQEIPNEVTLALNISNCPNRCVGCHSPHLWEDTGEVLDENVLAVLLEKYGCAVTCVCFMGGDGSPEELLHLAKFTKKHKKKTAWYSGNSELFENSLSCFDYIKLGNYIEELGGLKSSTTNQRFFLIENETMIDITYKFWKTKRDVKQAIQ